MSGNWVIVVESVAVTPDGTSHPKLTEFTRGDGGRGIGRHVYCHCDRRMAGARRQHVAPHAGQIQPLPNMELSINLNPALTDAGGN